ncbi:MAG: hypothetical protein O2856_05285 [Planctomycetota bacterium]|nr:hypothetical protein [Planctomycetota bacterium]
MILLYDGDPCAAIGLTRESGGIVVISQPVLLMNQSDQIRDVLYEMLLKQVKRRAFDDGFLRLRVLEQESVNDGTSAQLLTELGFAQVTEILQWEYSIARGDDEDSVTPLTLCDRNRVSPRSFAVQSCDLSTTNNDGNRSLLRAIELILECSSDLNGQPLPKAFELLAKWQSIDAKVFVCWIGQEIAAVMSCAAHTVVPPALSDATTAERSCRSPVETDVCIEYIGVVPAFRRRQTATGMIERIPALMLQSNKDAAYPDLPKVTRIKTYSDAANDPATRLYQKCRFVQVARMPMWCCHLDGMEKN